jgi:Uma2 family endonuclease
VRASPKTGRLFNADTGFLIARQPDTVRAPDIAFVGKERGKAPLPVGYFPGAPDLAVEIVSPSDRVGDVDEQVKDWLHAGCQEVWVVSPRLETIAIHRSSTDIRVLTAQDRLESPELLPGFSCSVAEVFAV